MRVFTDTRDIIVYLNGVKNLLVPLFCPVFNRHYYLISYIVFLTKQYKKCISLFFVSFLFRSNAPESSTNLAPGFTRPRSFWPFNSSTNMASSTGIDDVLYALSYTWKKQGAILKNFEGLI